MNEYLRKGILAGIGLASLTKEKIEEYANKFASENDLTEEEGKKFVDDLKSQAVKQKEDIEKLVENKVEEALEKLKLPSRKEIDGLKERVAELEVELGKLKTSAKKTASSK